jgi:hypothetical protein
MVDSLAGDHFTSVTPILIKHFQMMFVLMAMTHIKWPPSFAPFKDILRVATLDVTFL